MLGHAHNASTGMDDVGAHPKRVPEWRKEIRLSLKENKVVALDTSSEGSNAS